MANLNETAQWETGIYQLETSDPVMGGPDGIDNRQAKQLANRTLWLKKQTEDLQTATAGKAASSTDVTAGNGLTGGGNLTASRTISLGQPGQISAQSQNAVQSSGHTHAIDTATTSRAGIVQLADRVSTDTADANKAITTAAVKHAIAELEEVIAADPQLAARLGLWGRRVIGEEIGTFQRLLGQFPELLGQMAQEQLHSVLSQGAVSRMRGLGLRV